LALFKRVIGFCHEPSFKINQSGVRGYAVLNA
jgi:hypothetical protein